MEVSRYIDVMCNLFRKFPYRQSELFYDEKTGKYTFTDDGVSWQWGDTYINAGDPQPILDGIGGKYHRNNPDGSHTEFFPHELMFAGFAKRNEQYIRKVDKTCWCIVFKKEYDANAAYSSFNVNWYKHKGLKDIVLDKKAVYFIFEDWTWERTFFATDGNTKEEEKRYAKLDFDSIPTY